MDLLVSSKPILESLSYLAVIVGVPIALVEFIRKTRKEARAREYGTYNALDEKYLEYQGLCLEHPDLDVFDVPDRAPAVLDDQQKKQELITFTMLFSIFERAFLMYSDQSNKIRKRQWQGWQEYIVSYCSRANFREAWMVSGATFDTAFQDYMTKRLANAPL